MAGRREEFGPALPSPSLVIPAALGGSAWAASGFAPSSYIGSLDPNVIWELLIGGIAVASFLGAIGIWVLAALRKSKRTQLRRNAFVSSALNHLNQGVVLGEAERRIVYLGDRCIVKYELARSDVPRNMTGPELLEMMRCAAS